MFNLGDNFIFWCHPSYQRTPPRDHLNSWYSTIFARCQHLGIISEVSNLYDKYCMPYLKSRARDAWSEGNLRRAAKYSFVGSGSVTHRLYGSKKIKGSHDADQIEGKILLLYLLFNILIQLLTFAYLWF